LALTLLLSACAPAPDGPKTIDVNPTSLQPEEGLGQLILYKQHWQSGYAPKIYIDGEQVTYGGKTASQGGLVARCYDYGVILVNLPPGTYEVSIHGGLPGMFEKPWDELDVRIEPQNRTYVECVNDGDLELVKPLIGKQEVFKSEQLEYKGSYDLR
jgi:hypothetical protein